MSCSWNHFCEHNPMWIGTKETSQMSCLWTLLYLLQNRISTRHLIFHLRDIGLKPIEMKPKFEINKPQFTKIVFCFQNCSDLLWEKISKKAHSEKGSKVWTFWEAHIIWKNLPHGFDVYWVNQLICQNHKEDFFIFCVFLRKSELYRMIFKLIPGAFLDLIH